MRYDEATRLGELITQALNEAHSGKWTLYLSQNSFDPSIIERDGVRKEVKYPHWGGPKEIRDAFFETALTMLPPEEIEAKKERWWLLVWRCRWCDKVFHNLSGVESTEDNLDFLFEKAPRRTAHACGDNGRKGIADFIGIRHAKPDEVEKHLKERG